MVAHTFLIDLTGVVLERRRARLAAAQQRLEHLRPVSADGSDQ